MDHCEPSGTATVTDWRGFSPPVERQQCRRGPRVSSGSPPHGVRASSAAADAVAPSLPLGQQGWHALQRAAPPLAPHAVHLLPLLALSLVHPLWDMSWQQVALVVLLWGGLLVAEKC